MKKLGTAITTSMITIFLFAGIASAHVTVQPTQTTAGSYEMFTVRVPTEKNAPTTKIEVKFPSEVDVSRFESKPGWKYDIMKDSTGKITSVTWTATGEGLLPTEFGQFNMQGKVANDAKEISWKAIQTYKDGSTVEWVGASDSDTPAPVTKVNPKPTGTSTDGQGAAAPTTATPTNTTATGTSNTSLYTSIAALVASIATLVVSFKKKA